LLITGDWLPVNVVVITLFCGYIIPGIFQILSFIIILIVDVYRIGDFLNGVVANYEVGKFTSVGNRLESNSNSDSFRRIQNNFINGLSRKFIGVITSDSD
jgi:hypothetical protein